MEWESAREKRREGEGEGEKGNQAARYSKWE